MMKCSLASSSWDDYRDAIIPYRSYAHMINDLRDDYGDAIIPYRSMRIRSMASGTIMGILLFPIDPTCTRSMASGMIIAWVPVKSLLRFKSVCKAWNVTISDNEFRRTHRDQSKALGHEKLLLHKYYVRNSIIVYFDGKSDELKELPMPDFVGANTCFRLTSFKSCLCLYGGNEESDRLDIWIME
ncbi:hypothetical protein CQW23_32062 [Capsicum baccatum]|uniref:F-box domain-containing protein n=1 Tax=Capsicum baccatum TaxID=33114 RepID=A0A2G2V5S1_CAPBA|nr:hypothetical protein CQW23_32062 [Capsicum baccatum]